MHASTVGQSLATSVTIRRSRSSCPLPHPEGNSLAGGSLSPAPASGGVPDSTATSSSLHGYMRGGSEHLDILNDVRAKDDSQKKGPNSKRNSSSYTSRHENSVAKERGKSISNSSVARKIIMRNHSTAYAAVNSPSSIKSACSFFLARHYRPLVATSAFVLFVLAVSSDMVHDNGPTAGVMGNLRGLRRPRYFFGGAIQPGYFSVQDSIINENTFRFAAVTDLDQLSRLTEKKKPEFHSVLLPGILRRDPTTNTYDIEFEPTRDLTSKHNEAGRGMELSELTIFDNRLLAFDDRTGNVYELLNKNGGRDTYAVPRLVVTEGDGNTDKGMKWEWATVKNGELYMGSMGKEYTNADGSIANTNNMWIATANTEGEISRKDWTDEFNFVRGELGAAYPGYFINEAILWSDHLKKWVFLPRRVSNKAYDENEDEKNGSNKLAIVNDSFTSAAVVDVSMKEVNPLHGFSSFAFVPGTKDHHALAIRTVEDNCVGGDENLCKQKSFFIVFDVLTGEVLMDEKELPQPVKFEGVEFVNIYKPEPPTPQIKL